MGSTSNNFKFLEPEIVNSLNDHINLKNISILEEIDWEVLFEFQKSFRSKRLMSGSSFLRHLNLSQNCLQYLYSTKIRPSKRIGSIGLELRTIIEILLNSAEIQKSFPVDDSNLPERIVDILLNEDNKKQLNQLHILDVIVTNEDTSSVTIICSNQYDKDKIQQFLMELMSQFYPLFNITSYEVVYNF